MTLACKTYGTGPDLVLLHGWSMDGSIWGELSQDLAADFRVHALDLPGHGSSPHEARPDLDSMAKRVAESVPAGSIVLGWSLGGMVALRLAQDREAAVRGLVLIASTPRFCSGEDWPHGADPATLDSFASELDVDAATLMARFRASMCRGDMRERELRARMAKLPVPTEDRIALKDALGILRDTDLRECARGSTTPALVIHGTCDPVIPAQAGHWLADNLPGGRLHLLDDCAHLPFLSQPEACAALVRQFSGDLDTAP